MIFALLVTQKNIICTWNLVRIIYDPWVYNEQMQCGGVGFMYKNLEEEKALLPQKKVQYQEKKLWPNCSLTRAAAEVHLGSNWWNPELDDEDDEAGVKMNKKSGTRRSLVYKGQHLGWNHVVDGKLEIHVVRHMCRRQGAE